MARGTAVHGAAVVGRADELAAVDEFLAGIEHGPRALVLLGEAGVGKSTVWSHTVERSAELDYTLLRCRPAESDSRSSFAGLGDLFDHIGQPSLSRLPSPQRYALEVALLRRDADEAPPDRRTVAVAATALLRLAAARRPVLLAVDDAQWLDEPTAGVLAHLARRLTDEPVGIIAAVRTADAAAVPFGLDETLPAEHLRTLRLGGLDVPALRRLISLRTGLALPRPLLLRVHAAAGGNPFFALQLAAALECSAGRVEAGEPLPTPDGLHSLVRARIQRLPEPTREALLYVAALSHPTSAVVRAALGASAGDVTGLTGGEESGVIEIRQGRIRFTHPLFASTVYAAASTERRQAVHSRLAEVVADPEQRAWHLALTTDAPDARVADSLAEAARIGQRRGAPGTAAELWELAARRTPADAADTAQLRRVAAADCLFSAGDAARARALLEDAVATLAGPDRVGALIKLAEIVFYEGGTRRAGELCRQGLADTGGDELLAAELHLRRGWFSTHDAPQQDRSLAAALEIVDSGRVDPDPDLHACVLAVAAMYRFTNGGPISWDDLARARALHDPRSRSWAALGTRTALGAWAKYLDPQEARDVFQAENRLARQYGDEPTVGHTHMHLSEVEFWLGDWPRARAHALSSIEVLEQTGQHRWVGFALYAQAQVEGYGGDPAHGRAVAERGLELAAEAGDPYTAALHHQVLGGIGLGLGELEVADQHLTAAADLVRQMGITEPARYTFHPDQVEVAAALGRLDEAAALLCQLEHRVSVAPRGWLVAATARCRAVLLMAAGDVDGAGAAIEDARAACRTVPMPFERARTRLVEGRIWRARRQKLAAREALVDAQQAFEQLGAVGWAAQAAGELSRCGLRRGTADELTPTEEKVAALVASGLTNREVAAIAYISPKTVEANLSRIYRKLGVRNRQELARVDLESQGLAAGHGAR